MTASKKRQPKKPASVRRRLPRVQWQETEPTTHGNKRWISRDGMWCLVCSNQCDGIALPQLWMLWQWRHGGWMKVEDRRSRTVIEKIAAQRAAALNDDEGEE